MANSYTNSKFHGMGDNPVVDVNVEHVIPLGSKISTIGINDGPIIDAFNIDWTTGDYSYDSSGHIIESTGQLIEELKGKASTTSLDALRSTVNSLQTRSADYYEQRWRKANKSETITEPEDNDSDISIGNDDNTPWKLSPQYETGKNTWMISRKVVYVLNGSKYVKQYSGPWSDPMKMTGDDGIAYPVHQVLLYKWHNSRTAPTIVTNSSTKPDGWQESPGNSSGSNTYLFMIQGQRQDSNYIKWDANGDGTVGENEYWSAPICLSGPDGKTGEDGTDIEFIYKKFTSEQSFSDNDDNPSYWSANQGDDYLGPENHRWNDNPEGVSSSYHYEYCSIRYKTNKVWSAFISPFLWSKFGENGLDGDGIEYIYCACNYNNINDLNINCPVPAFNLNTSGEGSFQKSEVYDDIIWHDDPQEVNNTDQKYQWVSKRKYIKFTYEHFINCAKYIKRQGTNVSLYDTLEQTDDLKLSVINNQEDFNSIKDKLKSYLYANVTYGNSSNWFGTYLEFFTASNIIDVLTMTTTNEKYWSPYSQPELWNWYVNDGTNADRIVMLYMRNSSINTSPNVPTNNSNNQYTIAKYSYLGWAESPGNKTDYSENDETSYAYLWMTSNYYSEKTTSGNDTIYTLSDTWTTPVCLTGETGREGEDGADIEFIYFRTSNDNKTFEDGWDNFGGNSSENDWPFNTNYEYEIDEIKYYDPEGDFVEASSSDELHDVWTDNPLGVTSIYDYE